ncbi:MAG: hypothetical protein NC187_01055 [Candidatus Amulumruptor caecigallinarius]|nr:hypothetical protein [Candidatus Amulumruptor caecigallinarius]MCM1396064.1 hypothetical protein [Candidatus Amulumruptor caecigallinarius]MCM1453063.1 hypothetical protein [bacterium]
MSLQSFLTSSTDVLKASAKIALQSRRVSLPHSLRQRPLVVLGNGPSLNDTIVADGDKLANCDLLAVNFFANTDEFVRLRPRWYVMADPHFFTGAGSDPNVRRLLDRIATLTSWPMTLLVPARGPKLTLPAANPNVTISPFNAIGIEGPEWFTRRCFRRNTAMPRPRNVLIPSIMLGIALGYTTIFIAGADHSWMRTLSVTEANEVVSVQPHFYADNASEHERVTSVYSGIRLHQVVESFAIAFKAYHDIAAYARARGVEIFNATPGSFIDAFPRKPITHTI